LRWLRGSAVGAASVALATSGHVLGGGAVPAATVLLLSAGAMLLSVALSNRRWTLAPLLVVLLGTQVVCHVLLGGHGAGGASLHHPAVTAGAAGSPAGAMLAAHVAAALLTAWLLRCGDDCCARLVELLAVTWRVASAARPTTLRRPQLSAAPVAAAAPTMRELEHAVARRGPPARAVA
jgi:hypothetical protein